MLESTTYPGTTDELMVPAFEEMGLKVGQDVFIAFSPERVRSGQREIRHAQYAESYRRVHTRLHGSG